MSNGEKATVAEQIEQSSSGESAPSHTKPSRGARIKAFLRKWWWLLFLVFAAVVLIIVLPIVFVGIPRRAQKSVNESTLEIRSMILEEPAGNSFRLRLDEVLRSYSKFHPHLDAFEASLFLEDTLPNIKPFASVSVPAVHSTGAAPIMIDQRVEIIDLEQFTRYTTLVMQSEDYRLAIRGRTGLRLKGLRKMTVDYNEVVTMKGLNQLKGFNVTEFRILLQPDPDGANMVGRVFVPNPSVKTLEMGNVTLNLSVEDDFVGTALIPNLTLRPGDNTVEMRATANRTIILQKLPRFPDGIIPIDIIGNSSVYNGQHLTYYEDALKSNRVSIRLNVGAALRGG